MFSKGCALEMRRQMELLEARAVYIKREGGAPRDRCLYQGWRRVQSIQLELQKFLKVWNSVLL